MSDEGLSGRDENTRCSGNYFSWSPVWKHVYSTVRRKILHISHPWSVVGDYPNYSLKLNF
jgi:hypothetical protein